jgi:3-deoxy-D-manno-octulosonic-acid transferase
MHLLYSAALGVALLIGLPFWLVQMLRHGKYRAGVSDRFGRVPERLNLSQAKGSIWVHAVSVGEVLAVAGLITELRQRFPERRIYISTTTATGQELARARFGEEGVFYFPLDFAFALRPYLKALQPALVVVAETEFWPNFLRLADSSGAQVAIVNARISDRSLPRYLQFRTLLRRALSHIELFLAQSEEDARRLIAIGAQPEHVKVSGNLKFDVATSNVPVIVGQLRTAMIAGGAGLVIVAGSTVEAEELAVLDAFRRVLQEQSNSVLILAPRHPQRFAQVAELVASSGMKFWRRSEWKAEQAVCGGVFLLDTIGELGAIYQLADVAFVGGSLVPRGGHNILEPAMYGIPVIVGPHTENFRDIVELFRRAAAVVVVQDPSELAAELNKLLADPQKRRELGDRAADLVKHQAGATVRTVSELERLLQSMPGPQNSKGMPAR